MGGFVGTMNGELNAVLHGLRPLLAAALRSARGKIPDPSSRGSGRSQCLDGEYVAIGTPRDPHDVSS